MKIMVAELWTFHGWKADEMLRHISDDQLNLLHVYLAASRQKRRKFFMKNTAPY